MQPAGWDNFIAYIAKGSNPNGATLALVDSTRAHTGTKSVKVHGGQQPAQLTRPLPTGTNKLYARAWIWFTRQLGMNPGANHETLLGIRKAVGSANDEVRFGEIKGVIGTNEVPSDNISPKMAQWGMGPVVAPNGWRCIEVAFLADQAQHTLTAWADGVMVHAITAPDQWQNGNLPANWMNGKFVEFIMGWQSFSGIDTDLWIDDVVLSNSPIGCNYGDRRGHRLGDGGGRFDRRQVADVGQRDDRARAGPARGGTRCGRRRRRARSPGSASAPMRAPRSVSRTIAKSARVTSAGVTSPAARKPRRIAGFARGDSACSASQAGTAVGSSRSSRSSSGSTGRRGAAAHSTRPRTLSGHASAASIATSAPMEWPTSSDGPRHSVPASSPTASR